MTIKFSIIIPTYNRGNRICVTIDSVLKQRYRSFEIIVVDDGSTDNTEEIIKSTYHQSKEVKYFKQMNAERGVARNHGATLATGDYVNFFDSDDLMLPNHLEHAQKFLEVSKSEVFHLNYEIRNVEGKVIGKGPEGLVTANASLIKGNILSCNGVIMKREVALANPFIEDRTLAGMEDWELWLRLATMYPIHMIHQVTSVIVNHDGRSVLLPDNEKLVKRVSALIDLVLENPQVTRYYQEHISQFKSSCYTYIALHIALTKRSRTNALRFLWKGVSEDFSCLFTRRFLAILKHLLW